VRKYLRTAKPWLGGAAGDGVPPLGILGPDQELSSKAPIPIDTNDALIKASFQPAQSINAIFARQLQASHVRYRFQAFAPVAGKAHAFAQVA
jgi:hypothetical protein